MSGRITLIKKRKVSPDAQIVSAERDDSKKAKLEGKEEEEKAIVRPSYYGSLRNLIPEDWSCALKEAGVFGGDEKEEDILTALERRYHTETQEEPTHEVFPPRNDIFRALSLCPLAKVRVVILGQDPYCSAGQAMGLSFSVRRGVPTPPSLENIYKELQTEYGGDFQIPAHGDLTEWAEQGVLLLNSSLTVRAKDPGSHSSWEWMDFTDRIVEIICNRHQHVVFLLWGQHAQNKAMKIQGHYKLKAAHPSPKSAENGFFGCNHFKECNELLFRHGNAPIEWGKRMNGDPLPRPKKEQATMSDFVKITKRTIVSSNSPDSLPKKP